MAKIGLWLLILFILQTKSVLIHTKFSLQTLDSIYLQLFEKHKNMNRINKIIAIIMISGLTAGTASAQFYLGPRAGLNMSNMSYNTAGTENQMIMGFHGGVTARYQFLQRLSVQMDGSFSTMGNLQKMIVATDAVTTTTETTTKANYVQIPIYLNFEKKIMPDNLVPYRVKKSSMSFHLYGGGFFGYALSATSEIKTTQAFADGTVTASEPISGAIATDDFNPIDFGIMAGVGFSFKMDDDDRNRLGIDARYLMGFSNFDKRDGYTASNSAIQASLFFTRKLTNRKYTTRHRR